MIAGPRHALEDVRVDARRHEMALADHEQVLGGALGHLALVREDDGLLVAVEHRLRLGEGRVHVRADDLRRARGCSCPRCAARRPSRT